MANSAKIHWGRVSVGGFLAELLVFAIVFPLPHFFGQRAFLASILIASAVMPFLFALGGSTSRIAFRAPRRARRSGCRFELHELAWGRPQPLLYKVSHGLKIVGGMAGGVVASRRKAAEG
jgi:predicted lysophospholipase L1 biosynthesis ABC-type transport system permease subunit